MIKIVKAEYLEHKIIRLWFSDQTVGDYDLQPLLGKQTELVHLCKMTFTLNNSFWS